MWAIRILSGPQAGQIFPLAGGKYSIGRGPVCEVKINSNSVSKEHAAVLVTGDKIIISDMNSRNGTFVNGVRIQNQRINVGDKISLHDVLLDVLKVPNDFKVDQPMIPRPGGVYTAPPPSWAGNAALALHHDQPDPANLDYQPGMSHMQMQNQMQYQQGHQAHQGQASANSLGALFYNFKIYIDNVAMPGIYTIVKAMPFRYAICALVSIYVIIVTGLSTVPIVNTTKKSIKQESVRRALTIARNLAAVNRQGVIENKEERLSVRQAELEEGVTAALIITAKDGTILAPANKRGEFVNKPFVQKARREEKEAADFIDDSNLGVSIPISIYSPESGNQTVLAYVIILYDMGQLAMNASQTFSLFVQTLSISLLVGLFLFFFLYKIVEHPIDSLNAQLDDALREGRDDIVTDYQFAPLQRLISNINSALSRIERGSPQSARFVASRDTEAANVVRMLKTAAVAVNAIDDRVIATNEIFDRLVGGGVNLTGRPLTDIPDVALQENLRQLIPTMRASPNETSSSEIPFAGAKYEIKGHAVMGNEDVAYFLIVINPQEFSG